MRHVVVLAVAWAVGAAPAVAGVEGSFINADLEYPVVDGVAYERKAELGDGLAVRLALSMNPIDVQAIEAALDVEEAITAQRGESPYVDLEFALDGRYTGASYTLGSGNGCGWCADPKAAEKAQVRIENGVLRGTVRIQQTDYGDGDGPAVTLTIDLPVVKVTAAPLPADGGEPAKVLASCRELTRAKDAAGAKEGCFSPDDKLAHYVWEADGDAFWSMALMYERDSLSLPDMAVTGGRTKGEWAEVLVEGKDSNGTTRRGSVFLHKGSAGWRYHHEKLESVY
jgi:hypothetical protein